MLKLRAVRPRSSPIRQQSSTTKHASNGVRKRTYSTKFAPDPTLQKVSAMRPRRVLFNVPGSEEKFINKATTLDLDVLVFDFEDGVALNKKAEARAKVVNAIKNINFGRAEKSIRINSIRSGFEYADLEAIRPIIDKIDSILLPKTESAEDLKLIDRFLTENGDKDRRVKILAAVESASALLNLRDICFNSTPRLDALIFGSEDYSADVGITRTDGGEELLWARSQVVTYAAAAQLQAIDMVCIKYKDPEQLRKEAIQGFNMGYDGKQAIHPSQIPIIYECFTPAPNSIQLAERIVEEYKKKSESGVGAWEVDGKMIDMPMVRWAMRILQKANKLQ